MVKATPLNYQTKLEVVKQFTIDICQVNNILNCCDGTLWINDGNNPGSILLIGLISVSNDFRNVS
jgi:hypothetical protein